MILLGNAISSRVLKQTKKKSARLFSGIISGRKWERYILHTISHESLWPSTKKSDSGGSFPLKYQVPWNDIVAIGDVFEEGGFWKRVVGPDHV
jgi:hypothetical protein